jgi:hypothetical protein
MSDTPSRELVRLDSALAEAQQRRRVIDQRTRQANEDVYTAERAVVDAMRRDDTAGAKSAQKRLATARELAARDQRLETQAAGDRIMDRQGAIRTFIREHGDELLASYRADGEVVAARVDKLLGQLGVQAKAEAVHADPRGKVARARCYDKLSGRSTGPPITRFSSTQSHSSRIVISSTSASLSSPGI